MFKTALGFSPLAFETVYKTDVRNVLAGFDEVNFEHIRKKQPQITKKLRSW